MLKTLDLFAASENRWSKSLGDPAGQRADGNYRFLLWRTVRDFATAKPLVFCMLNPSTADDVESDPTITRCIGFARRERAGGIIVVNLSPYRATYPKDLDHARSAGWDVLSFARNVSVMSEAANFGPFVLAWGAGIRPWMAPAATIAKRIGHPSLCLGTTLRGEPRHPLMLRADTPLSEYS